MINIYNSSLSNVAYLYLKYLGVNTTKGNITNLVEFNPYYPSLYTLSEVFDKLNVSNKAFNLDISDLDLLNQPFVAFVNTTGGGQDFVLVTKVSGDFVYYHSRQRSSQKVKRDLFLKQWTGITFLAEKSDKSEDKNYDEGLAKEKSKTLRRFSVILLASLLFALGIINSIEPQLYVFLFYTTKLVGLAVTILLLVYEFDNTNIIVKNICSFNRKTNCNAVLNSKQKGMLGFTWSEIGFLYFLGATLFLFYPNIEFSEKTSYLSFLSIIVSPFIIFSIYYQWKVIKNWCILCLFIQLVLLIELISSVILFLDGSELFFINHLTIPFLISFIVPLIVVLSLKQPLLKAFKNSFYEGAYKRLLYNPDIFTSILNRQDSAPEGWSDLGISIGNPYANNTLLKICNPYCGPCAKIHLKVHDLVADNQNFNLRILFMVPNSKDDYRTPASLYLTAAGMYADPQKASEVLDAWYSLEEKDFDSFKRHHPLHFTDEQLVHAQIELDKMFKWCVMAEITSTPTMYVNGRLLPDTYDIDNLKYIGTM